MVKKNKIWSKNHKNDTKNAMNDTKNAITEHPKTTQRAYFMKRSSYNKKTYFMSETYTECV